VIFASNQRQIPECLALADVLVSSNTVKPESFGLTLIEAMAMGKPVVAKPFGGAKEIVVYGENGFFAAGDTPADFAEAIAKAFVVPFDSVKIRESALRRFSLAAMFQRTLSAYNELARQ